VTGAVKFCLGASTALRRSTLEAIGGLEALADYLVEDYEMGRRIWESGKRTPSSPTSSRQSWTSRRRGSGGTPGLLGPEQPGSAARRLLFAVVLRSIPFALLFAARAFSMRGSFILAAARRQTDNIRCNCRLGLARPRGAAQPGAVALPRVHGAGFLAPLLHAANHGVAGRKVHSYERRPPCQPPGTGMKRVIITGDDFGLAEPVNEPSLARIGRAFSPPPA